VLRDPETESQSQSQSQSSLSMQANTNTDANINTANAIRFEFPKGAEAGNFLHTLLETVTFCEPNWRDCNDIILGHAHLVKNREAELVDWLNECLQTKLPCGVSLAEIAEDRLLKETSFYFTIPRVAVDKLFDCLIAHRTIQRTSDDLPTILPNRNEISGMMCGFIDLIFEHDNRYYIVDYKSTFLGSEPRDYQHERLQNNIESSNYDLQFLIYTLALHRYLRQCLPNYDCEKHLGGVYYLYLRGLKNQQDDDSTSKTTTGVFHTTISPQIITRLDHLFLDTSQMANNQKNQSEVLS
jgi:exodeoxyribonuclease V beta subunit